jgi:hypothetical protein
MGESQMESGVKDVKVVAVVGAGRMGIIVGKQLPGTLKKIIIDHDEAKAKSLAEAVGGAYALSASGAKEADLIAMVLPAGATNSTAKELAAIAKSGAVILNMATAGKVSEEVIKAYPAVTFVDAKIIGSAKAMTKGLPSLVVANTKDEAVCEKVRSVLPGYKKVVMGDSDLVPKINTIGSSEGIRAAVNIRKKLKEFNLPKEWEDMAIYTVCTGTTMAYVDDDLGEFARELADKLEKEQG